MELNPLPVVKTMKAGEKIITEAMADSKRRFPEPKGGEEVGRKAGEAPV
jgi:hypothetical protein